MRRQVGTELNTIVVGFLKELDYMDSVGDIGHNATDTGKGVDLDGQAMGKGEPVLVGGTFVCTIVCIFPV
jgi:hypothetical protein